jgi:Tol biopolymer transport system component
MYGFPRNCAVWVIVAGLLATSRLEKQAPATSSSRLTFASHRDGNWEIYSSDTEGRLQTRLTRRESQDRFPMWSPDRTRIAFGSQVGGDHWELWVMNADGTAPRSLATQIVAKGSRQWSHDGTRIVFAAKVADNVDIFIVDVQSSRLTRLTESPDIDGDPSWSPDDRHIAFSSMRDGNPEIYVMRADGSHVTRFTNDAAPDGSPAWSPDGSRIAFVSTRHGDRDVFAVRLANGREERLTTGAHATNDALRWSPNGEYIAIQTAAQDNYDIQLVRLADRSRTTVAGSPAFDGHFSWSPDSDRLAFISERDGYNAVYVTDLHGKQTRLTTTSSLNPDWSR